MVDTVLLIVVEGGGGDWEKRACEADGLADPEKVETQASLIKGSTVWEKVDSE